MMELSPETLDLLEAAIYSGATVFISMLLLHLVGDLVIGFFKRED